MGGNDRREQVALGVSLFLCAILVAVALTKIDGSSSLASADVVRAMALPESAIAESPDEFAATFVDEFPEEPAVLGATVSDEPCVVSGEPLGYGSFGDDIFCLQKSLANVGRYTAVPNGLYDDTTFAAVLSYQRLLGLHDDGIVGRKTGTSLGIWPLDPFTVIRTPVPEPGSTDLTGFPLSSVAVSGPDAPPLPPNSGSGRRLVYDRAGQRVWAVDENETVLRSWLVSGSRDGNETPGTHKVYSKSRRSISQDGEATFSYMVRWLRTSDDAIGFHSLPRRTLDDSLYQSEDELGIRLSSGCQRQADIDAEFTWNFARVGTVVVVL